MINKGIPGPVGTAEGVETFDTFFFVTDLDQGAVSYSL